MYAFPWFHNLGDEWFPQSELNELNKTRNQALAQPAESTKVQNGHGQQLEKLHEAPQIKWALLWLRITQNWMCISVCNYVWLE